MGPGWGIDDLQKRYSRLNLVAFRPHYDLVTLMDHMGSSLDRLEVDQRGRTFPPRAPRRLAATPNGTVSCLHSHLNSAFALCDRPLLKADPVIPW